MRPQQFGNINVSRVAEMEYPAFTGEFIFPAASPEIFAANAAWLEPHFVEPTTRKLIMSFHTYVVRTGRRTILVDMCVGNDKERPNRPMWHHMQGDYLAKLAAAGVAPESVDVVMCTHMHADHVGWNTKLLNGRWVPTFPNAKYVFGRKEYEFWAEAQRKAAAAEPVNHGSFNDSVLPVIEAGQAVLVEDDHELERGIRLAPAHGHTPGNIVIHLDSNDRRAILSGDVLHHPVQLAAPHWSSRFCEDEALSRRTRTGFIESCADTPTTILTAHFATPTAGKIVRQGDAFRFKLD